ncbi:SusC/RagA family TonB-linked outer membrane protein [Hymenobacter lutimineralis]|uniref:SusC/RagA family TonB-linked outer membrane protein n=1 Tax=Hymenobacter lutimineralis TaxID=2606448 RepID=A0A5D6V714_9BACT|nr:SusC/RagA family TonB-linked outer membrane protein [Hymenobacter lutimineralis]TYZ10464.1 SusC/RagA family TonB-linked outer membrane protein [Hymenobacter lutimineralis]
MKHPYLPKLLFLLLFVCAGFTSALAQTGSVSGRIVDEKNQGLPGVTVLISGTTLGTSTNSDGQYSIQNVPAGPQTIVASFVGFTTMRRPVTVAAGQNSTVDVNLVENTTLLNEAVVVAYGTQRRQDVTGAVSQISEKEFVKGQVTNPEQLVQGKVAGLQVTTGGAPGAGSEIRIRGGSSLNASNDPLIVIDGVPVDNIGVKGASNPLALINPNDIESISVLKDASSTAIYGSRGSNGVIIVTTKRGLQGEKLRVSASTNYSISEAADYVDVLNGPEFRALVNARGTASQKAALGTSNTDWQKAIYRTANTSDNNVSLMGSIANVPVRVSGGYLYQEGLLKRNDLKRYSGSVGVSPRLLNDNLKVDLNLRASQIENNFSNQGAVNSAVFFDPTQPITSTSSEYAPFGGYFEVLDASGNLNTIAPRNPVSAINQRNDRSTVNRSIGNAQLDYKLPFLSGLSANLNLGFDVQRGKGTIDVPKTAGTDFNRGGVKQQYRQDLNNKLLETLLKYNREIGGAKFDVLGGYSWQEFQNKNYNFDDLRADGSLFQPANKTYDNKTEFQDQYNLVSFFGRANVNIKDRYLFTGTFRADGTSRFANNKWGYFPSASVAWRLKGEDFLKDSKLISDFKLRLGYGQTGQQDIGINYYPSLPFYTQGVRASSYVIGGKPVTTLRPDFYSADLKWETTTTYNAGLDYGFFDGRVYGSVDVYKRDTDDLINEVFVAAGSYPSNGGLLNVGSLTNKGVEVITTVDAIKGDKFNLSVSGNATFNRNKLTKLTTSDEIERIDFLTGGINNFDGVGNGDIQVNSVDYQAQSFFPYQQVYGTDGKPLEGVFVDRDGDGAITVADRYRYKSPRPTAILGFSSNMSYGKASLAFTLRSNIGNYVYNNIRSRSLYVPTSGYNRNSTPEVLKTGFTTTSPEQIQSDYYIENGSFLRMQNITLGYDFGSLVKENSNLSLSFAVQNAFLITKYSGLDPEIANGIDNTVYPRPRTYTLGLNFGF